MPSRIRIALGLALLLSLLSSVTISAKGDFYLIVVAGADLKDEVRILDPALTTDFFAFADFSRDQAEVPADPGVGYQVTRYYLDGGAEIAFDKLHFYPDTGFVYYDGIVNGSSEYDHQWYTAQPEIKSAFEAALFTQMRLMTLGAEESSRALVPPVVQPEEQKQTSTDMIQPRTFGVVMASLIRIFLLGFLGSRRPSPS